MSDKELVQLGNRIRKLRLSKKMTLVQLAAECDFDTSNMARIEKGNTNPPPAYACALHLLINFDYL